MKGLIIETIKNLGAKIFYMKIKGIKIKQNAQIKIIIITERVYYIEFKI